jgi:hypothetical protein
VTINVAVVRLWLLLPAQAIGNTSLTFKQAWNRTRGNVWRLVWGVAATTLPMVVIHIILLLRFGLPHLGRLEADFVSRMTAGSILGTACDLLILPISIGFLSHAYRHFFEAPPESATSHNHASPLNS